MENEEEQQDRELNLTDVSEITAPFHRTMDKVFIVAAMAILMAIMFGGTALYYARHAPESPQCEMNNQSSQAQSVANKAQAEFNLACMKRDIELRLKVIDACVAHGNIPIFMNGNVDCKPGLK